MGVATLAVLESADTRLHGKHTVSGNISQLNVIMPDLLRSLNYLLPGVATALAVQFSLKHALNVFDRVHIRRV